MYWYKMAFDNLIGSARAGSKEKFKEVDLQYQQWQ